MQQDFLHFQSNSTPQDKTLNQDFLFETYHLQTSSGNILTIIDHTDNLQKPCFFKQTSQQNSSSQEGSTKKIKQRAKRVRKYTSNNPDNRKGHWSIDQNLKYHLFLELHARQFIDSERRKTDKIFKAMASFIGTRQAHQCRSHHQKIQNKWGSFLNILLKLRIQNFKKTDSKLVLNKLCRLGYEKIRIFEDYELENQEELYIRIFEQKQKQKGSIQQEKTQLSNEYQNEQIEQDNQSRCHQQNCLCLMMSETYEDHLKF